MIVGIGGHLSWFPGPLCWPTPFCFVVINPAFSKTDTLGRNLVSMLDVNGDGLPDLLVGARTEYERPLWGHLTGLLSADARYVGGKGAVTFQIADGSVLVNGAAISRLEDAGLSLSTDGTLFGRPMPSTDIKFTVLARDTAGHGAISRDGTVPNQTFTINGAGSDTPVTVRRVLGGAVLIGVINMVMFIALSTVGSVVYNFIADLIGGVELTLSEGD